jgi:hypothetical protein
MPVVGEAEVAQLVERIGGVGDERGEDPQPAPSSSI